MPMHLTLSCANFLSCGNRIRHEAYRHTLCKMCTMRCRSDHRLLVQMQIDMRVIEPGFDEGADEVRWSRFMK